MGLSELFRSPWFPLWLGVESRALEFVGLESGLGLEMGEFFHPAVRDSCVGNGGCTGSHGFRAMKNGYRDAYHVMSIGHVAS